MPEDSKTCTKCHETKTLSEFYRDRKSRDGRHSHCKDCRNGYYESWKDDNRSRVDEYQREYSRVNRDKRTKWRADNRDKVNGYARDYYERNHTKVLANARQYNRRYRQTKPEAIERHKRARRDRLKGAPTDASVTLTAVCEWFGYVCHLCGNMIPQNASERRLQPTLDHVVPVSSPDYPNHGTTWDNVRPAHRGCNSARSNKPLDAWFAYLARARSRAPWFTDERNP